VLCRDSFFSLSVETLRLLCYSRAHPLCFSYRLQRSSICQSLLRIVFLHWTKLGDSSSPLAITQRSLRILWQTPSMVSGSFTVSCISSPPISFSFIHIQNSQPHTVCLIFFYTHLHGGSTSHFLRQKKDNCPSN
jgi:hypothetical protein